MNRILFAIFPAALMISALLGLAGFETWLAAFGTSSQTKLMLGRIGLAMPCSIAGAVGVILLFASAGATNIRSVGWSVVAGAASTIAIVGAREGFRLADISDQVPVGQSVLAFADPSTLIGTSILLLAGLFALRVGISGNAVFAASVPRRIRGRRAIHGETDWMAMNEAARLFPENGGIVIGERYRVDRDGGSHGQFRSSDKMSWGAGGKSPLLCFDGSFGSSHGIVFAGSGGFKTTSVTVPTALNWYRSLVVLDPSNEVAPMVAAYRRMHGRDVIVLDPKMPSVGFNVLDWIGRSGSTPEEDISAIASWIITDNPRLGTARDDFFRGAALQLLTALIADVCLSGHTKAEDQNLRQVRANLSEPEPKLRERLQTIYGSSQSAFVRENVAPFIAMTAETFSGVYANAAKETHWLSYPNYAALVSSSVFRTNDVAEGKSDVFVNLDLKALENHPGLARVIIGSLLNAVYNCNHQGTRQTLFLLDEAARLGFMRILEIARDAGRKYGISLLLLYQSIGQMREAYGGRDASSKWFESASWISFGAINDPETAEYISRRCGDTTVEVDQLSRSSQMSGSSRTRSKQLARRPLILPHEVLRMRADEQIIFTAGNPPLRCGRAIWFRRDDMKTCIAEKRFQQVHADQSTF